MRGFAGILLSLAVIIAVSIYSISHWAEVKGLKPNELCDSLSGIAATLALIWIVIGYFQQGEELRSNTAALTSQQKEMEAQAKYLQQMAEFAKAQAEAMQAFAESAKLQATQMDRLAGATRDQVRHDKDLASAAKDQAKASEKLADAIRSIERKIR